MRKLPMPYLVYVIVVLCIWASYMYIHNLWSLYNDSSLLEVAGTMIFGAFVAGSSPEGSAAIAYPIFTLWLDISPDTTRNFAFAIQSFGMTAASIYILSKRLALEWTYILHVSVSGFIGLLLGTFYIDDHISVKTAKLFFVSLWVGLAIILLMIHRNEKQQCRRLLPKLNPSDFLLIWAFGVLGGIISSVFGTGINILTFCLMAIYYHLDIRIATRSSIIIMSIETIIGLYLHSAVLKDFSSASQNMWLVCIPIVIFAAPLGTKISTYFSPKQLSNFIASIFIIQFFGALVVIRPTGWHLAMSLMTIMASLVLFYIIYTFRKDKMV